MKKIFKRKSAAAQPQLEPDIEPQVEPDLAVAIDKIQRQLTLLENKIDTLISQASERPSGGSSYSKPFQQFDSPRRFDRGNRESSFRDRSFTRAICSECKKECEVPFKPTGDRPVYCKECFSKRNEGGSGGSFKDKFERKPEFP